MSPGQLALYGVVRQELLKRKSGIKINSNIDLMSAKRSIMRLLQLSSNPILVVRSLTGGDPEAYLYDDPKLESIFLTIVTENDSPKMLRTAELARYLVAQGNRVVIWSNFKHNVERLSEILSDVGATYIHGDINTGSDSDPNTREGRIRMFHDDNSGCRVLVANPAACGEGISLHHVCHHAIYLDRTYNAAHFLQSVDRIHRLGLKRDIKSHVYILETIAPNDLGSVDYSVRRRLILKLETMANALDDTDLRKLKLDEEDGDEPVDYDVTRDDILDLIDELSGCAPCLGEEQL